MTTGRKTIPALIAAAVILICAGSSAAYFSAGDKAENVFTVGAVKIELTEPSWKPDEEHLISPGAVFEKDPIVKNTGTNAAYVRIRLAVTDADVFKEAGAGADPLEMLGPIGDKWVLTEGPSVKDDRICCSWCYEDPVEGSSATPPLFKTVTMPEYMTSETVESMGGEFDIIIAADAIQNEGFENYSEAFAAFDAQSGN